MQDKLRGALKGGRVRWRSHAQQRMLERGILRSDVRDIIEHGQIIEEYLDASPYPSFLIFGLARQEPLHTLVAYSESDKRLYVITAYQPDGEHYELDHVTRKREL